MNKKKMEILGGTLAGMMFLSGCSTITETSRTPLVETATLPTPAITLEYIVGAGGEMNAAQKSFLDGAKGTEYQNAVLKYADYWQKVKLIGQNITIGIGVMPDMNDATDQSKMLPYFELPGPDYVNVRCTLPWAQYENYLVSGNVDDLLPPTSNKLLTNADIFCMSTVVTKDSIPALAGIPIGSVWANVDAQPVYIDPTTKEVVGNLNKDSKWELDKFTVSKLSFVPKEVSEIDKTPEVISPIADPEGYKEQFNNKIKPITDKILVNYTGKMITGGLISIDPERGSILFRNGNVLNPIASAHFEFRGHEVPILYFPAEDGQGRFALGMIISPTMDYCSGYDSNNNLVFNWHLEDIIKRFPASIGNNQSIAMMYTNTGKYNTMGSAKDPFFVAYFSGHEDPNYQTVLWKYFLGENGVHSDFDRNYISYLLLMIDMNVN